MRARHRHFNARDIGARLVLDARYIGQSDNTAVSTWADRSGNGWDATQATGANRPTFRVNQFGEAGGVRFDGSNDSLGSTGAVGLLNNVSGGTLLGVWRGTAGNASAIVLFFSRNSSNAQARAQIQTTNPSGTTHYAAGGRRLDADGFQNITSSAAYSNNRALIHTGVFDYANSDLFLFLDGAQEASNTNFQTAGNTSATNSNLVEVGASTANSFYTTGEIGLTAAFPSALTAAQRKRVEHSAARSFKLSCN